jgi:hypothetical protein
VSVLLLWREIVLKMRTCFYKKNLVGLLYYDPVANVCIYDLASEVVLCPISYCRDVFSPYLGKTLDFVIVHWSFIFVSHVSRLIVEFI